MSIENTASQYTSTLFHPQHRIEPVVRNRRFIPKELKNESIWLIAADTEGTPNGVDEQGYSTAKIPCIVTDNGLLQRFSNNMGHKAMSYTLANSFAENYGYDIGILMSSDNPYTVVDLDAKGITDESMLQSRLANFAQIINVFNGYSEQSQSGVGYHIIVKSEILIARNFRRSGIEIYSYRERFMLCTGNTVSSIVEDDNFKIINHFEKNTESQNLLASSKPIEYRDDAINALTSTLGVDYQEHGITLIEREAVKSDEAVINDILQSTFADTFMEITLYTVNTDFTNTKYPSGSEAVLNVISILCRFTESNSQVKRLFLELNLSKRDKYTKNDYHINRCLTIARSDQDLSMITDFIDNSINLYHQRQQDILNRRMLAESDILKYVEDKSDDTAASELSLIESEYEADIADFSDIPIPHGLIGDIAQYGYDSAPHKLKVAAIAAALVIISGIVGRQYRYRGSSLNNYFVVIGYSTMGKEAAASCMSAVSKALSVSGGDKFFCFDKISSGQALRTLMRLSDYGSIAATFPEFSLLVNQLKDGNDSAMSGLKGELLDVATKNKQTSRYGGSKHAKSEDEREGMEAPAFSFVGDTTPDFYDGVTEEMASGGFMSRLILLSHDGAVKSKADPLAHTVTLRKDTIDDLNMLVQQVISKYNSGVFIPVEVTCPLVTQEVDRLEDYLILKFNKAKDESHRQVYGRAFLKVMTIASLFAAVHNLGNPTISMEDFQWARALVMRDIFITVHKLNAGEIGVSEANCKRRVRTLIDKLTRNSKHRDKLAKTYNHVLDLGIFPRSLLSQRLQGNSFKIGNMSNTKTLEAILDNMIKNGDLTLLTEEQKGVVSQFTGRSIRGLYYQVQDDFFNHKIEEMLDWIKNRTSPEGVLKRMNDANSNTSS